MADPWRAEPIGAGRFRIVNVSDGKLAMITLSPFGSTEAQVITGGAKEDPHVVKSPIEPGDFFVAIVRGEGVRVTATAVPSMTPVYFDLLVS